MDIKTLSQETGKSETYIRFILSRKRRPSPQLAATLEDLTGIDRRAWLWPDEFANPMLHTTLLK